MQFAANYCDECSRIRESVSPEGTADCSPGRESGVKFDQNASAPLGAAERRDPADGPSIAPTGLGVVRCPGPRAIARGYSLSPLPGLRGVLPAAGASKAQQQRRKPGQSPGRAFYSVLTAGVGGGPLGNGLSSSTGLPGSRVYRRSRTYGSCLQQPTLTVRIGHGSPPFHAALLARGSPAQVAVALPNRHGPASRVTVGRMPRAIRIATGLA
jgi:hypothetical protein